MAMDLSMPVLVVDDYNTMIRIIRNLLKQLGFENIDDASDGSAALDVQALLAQCRLHMPAYMVPHGIGAMCGPLPRNPNGKIDRKLLCAGWHERHGGAGAA